MTDLGALECIVVDLTPTAKEHNKQEIERVRKSLEVLEILKNKNVDVDLIKNIMKDNRKFECYPDDNLTQEEFELVKEWIENDK